MAINLKGRSLLTLDELSPAEIRFLLWLAFSARSTLDLARFSGVPVYDGLTDETHPTQALADFMTMHTETNVGAEIAQSFGITCIEVTYEVSSARLRSYSTKPRTACTRSRSYPWQRLESDVMRIGARRCLPRPCSRPRGRRPPSSSQALIWFNRVHHRPAKMPLDAC